MEFSITCPIDGSVDVSLEDIETVVLKEQDRADITFLCPHCGTQIMVTAVVPSFLLSAIEALALETQPITGSTVPMGLDDDETDFVGTLEVVDTEDDSRFDAYCEYFRRQLEHVGSVDDALHEMDSRG